MASYSRAHYRRVSPPADTLDQVVARLLDTQARDAARADRDAAYPTVTIETFDAACDYSEERVRFHRARLDRDVAAHTAARIEATRLLKGRR